MARGYWKLPDATAEVFREDGWFLTGDIGHLDADGVLFVTDRKKDMIIMSGWKIYPTEVEDVLIGHDAIADVAVYGVPDERRGEIPVAAVVLAAGASLTLDESPVLLLVPARPVQVPAPARDRRVAAPGPRLEAPPAQPARPDRLTPGRSPSGPHAL